MSSSYVPHQPLSHHFVVVAAALVIKFALRVICWNSEPKLAVAESARFLHCLPTSVTSQSFLTRGLSSVGLQGVVDVSYRDSALHRDCVLLRRHFTERLSLVMSPPPEMFATQQSRGCLLLLSKWRLWFRAAASKSRTAVSTVMPRLERLSSSKTSSVDLVSQFGFNLRGKNLQDLWRGGGCLYLMAFKSCLPACL